MLQLSASQDILIFQISDEYFGLKTIEIQEIIPFETITPIPRAPSYIAGIMNFRGTLLTILDTAIRVFENNHSRARTPRYILIGLVESWPVGLTIGNVEGIVKSEIGDFTKDTQSAQLLKNVKKRFCEGIIKWTIDKTENTCILLDLGALTKQGIS